MRVTLCAVVSIGIAAMAVAQSAVDIRPAVRSQPVATDADDPAIWVNPRVPGQSLILGTNKSAAPVGALVVFGLDGRIRQSLGPLDRPNNVDVEYGLRLQGVATDIAVVTERLQHRLRVYRIRPDGTGLDDISSEQLRVFSGASGAASEPMGISLYRRPRDGAIFAIVSRKSGPRNGYLWQYRLEDNGAGRVRATKVREFGTFSGTGEIEAVAVDDAPGYVYYSDELSAVRKWRADPDHPDAARELAAFATTGFAGQREGIGVFVNPDGTGYVVVADQVPGNSRFLVFRREGEPNNPHNHTRLLKVVRGGADETDGIDVTSAALGPSFPHGMLVAMNSRPRNFLFFRWSDFAAGSPVLP